MDRRKYRVPGAAWSFRISNLTLPNLENVLGFGAMLMWAFTMYMCMVAVAQHSVGYMSICTVKQLRGMYVHSWEDLVLNYVSI